MFQTSSPESRLGAAIYLSERIYHASVRKVRQKHGNALLSILVTIGQTALFTLAFYIMFAILPIRAASIRGDFFIYTMSGVFLFMAHIQTVKAISASEKSTSAMMQHAPMNTAIAITASALSELYTQLMAGSVLLFGYYVAISPFEIKEPVTCVGMVILAWMSGIAVGLVFMAAKPWAPGQSGCCLWCINGPIWWLLVRCLWPTVCHLSCFRCLTGTRCFTLLIRRGDLLLLITPLITPAFSIQFI